MTSTSVLGSTQITLQFDLDRNIDAAAQDVQSAIDAAGGQLPKNLPVAADLPQGQSGRFADPDPGGALRRAAGHARSTTMPRTSSRSRSRRSRASRRWSIGGQQKPAVRVQVDPAKLAALGIQLEDVASVIATATVDAPKGSINGPLRNFAIYDNDQLLKAAPWNDVVVAYKNGAPVRIRDIGVAVDGPENNQLTAWQNGQPRHPAADLQAARRQRHRRRAARQGAAAARAGRRCRRRSRSIMVADRTTTINASVHDVEFTLLLTIALVVMVIFLFLRNAWATIIPGRHRAAGAARHRGGDVRAAATAWTTCR